MAVTESGTLHHVCFVVDDLGRVAQEVAGRLGVGPWDVWTIEPEEGTLHGRSAREELEHQGREMVQDGSLGDQQPVVTACGCWTADRSGPRRRCR